MKQHCVLYVLLALSLIACQPIQPESASAQQGVTPQLTAPPLTADEKITNAMSAVLPAIAQDAAVRDWPVDPTLGEAKELRAGSNGWVCRPDDPTSPTNDPRCLDANWLNVFGLDFGLERETQTALGIAYMLQGDSVASNDDPAALQPLPARSGRSTHRT